MVTLNEGGYRKESDRRASHGLDCFLVQRSNDLWDGPLGRFNAPPV